MKTDEIHRLTDGGWHVFAHYFRPDFRLRKSYRSPLMEDRHPSFSLFQNRYNGRIYFKDFRIKAGDAITFVQELFQCTFKEACEKIEQEVIGQAITSILPVPLPAAHSIDHATIIPTWRHFTEHDYRYFARFAITPPVLDLYRCRPIERYTVIKTDYNGQLRQRTKYAIVASPIYGYDFGDEFYKVNEPLYQTWVSNTQANQHVFGLHLLTGPVPAIVICAGNKDTMSFHSVTGLTAVSLQSESTRLTPELYATLRRYTDTIYSLYDNDEAGEKGQERLYYGYSIHSINEPVVSAGVSDFAQLVEQQLTQTGNVTALKDYYQQLTTSNY